jgi:hypothetical protein
MQQCLLQDLKWREATPKSRPLNPVEGRTLGTDATYGTACLARKAKFPPFLMALPYVFLHEVNKMSSLNLFISYSHADDDLRLQLETHLKVLERQGVLRMWSDSAIEAGAPFEGEILRNLKNADIILLLISAHFLASDFCHGTELKLAMERHHRGETRVIPVFLRSCDWKHETFGKLQGVPDGAKPVTQWGDRDEAFTRVCSAIRRAAEVILSARNVKLAGDERSTVDLSKIQYIIDWDKVNAAVIEWAKSHYAEDPYDMGPRNYQKCLYDIGLGGEDRELEYENGRLKYQ